MDADAVRSQTGGADSVPRCRNDNKSVNCALNARQVFVWLFTAAVFLSMAAIYSFKSTDFMSVTSGKS